MIDRRLKHLFTLSCLVTITAGSPLAWGDDTSPTEYPDIVFYAMGDVPYAPEEDRLLPEQIAKLPNDGAFVVHVGDIKKGATPCDEAVYLKVSGMLKKCQTPLFVIPGDNEWNDCLRPDEAWQLWEKYFLRFDQNWRYNLPIFRQLEREENFAFVLHNVLFLGINLVGGRVHDAEEWKLRHAQNLDWIRRNIERSGESLRAVVLFGHALASPKHADFFGPLIDEAVRFRRPILYLHGDGHVWVHDRPFRAQNIVRVQVDQGGKAPPLKVTIRGTSATPFEFDRRLPE